MSVHVKLTQITPFHAPALALIHSSCFHPAWTEAEFATLLQNPVHQGFICDKGFILYAQIADEKEVLTFGVLPDYRRQGIGQSLLQALLSPGGRIFLEVREDNIPARCLYEKMGFSVTGRRPRYYITAQGACDAICYAWPVEPKP